MCLQVSFVSSSLVLIYKFLRCFIDKTSRVCEQVKKPIDFLQLSVSFVVIFSSNCQTMRQGSVGIDWSDEGKFSIKHQICIRGCNFVHRRNAIVLLRDEICEELFENNWKAIRFLFVDHIRWFIDMLETILSIRRACKRLEIKDYVWKFETFMVVLLPHHFKRSQPAPSSIKRSESFNRIDNFR